MQLAQEKEAQREARQLVTKLMEELGQQQQQRHARELEPRARTRTRARTRVLIRARTRTLTLARTRFLTLTRHARELELEHAAMKAQIAGAREG